eukprot:gene9717-1923_t
MAGRQVGTKSIQWASIAARIPSFNVPELNMIQDKYNTVKASLAQLPEKPPAIDWSKYSNVISYNGFVDNARKEYDSLKFTYPEDKSSSSIAVDEKEALRRAEELAVDASKKIAELEQQLASLKIDEVLATKPEWKRRLQEEVDAGKWE